MGNVVVKLADVTKTFGEVTAVDHVSLEIFAGEFFSMLGPSGCGKTTLLRLIAGLEEPASGEIYLDGDLINATPPYERDVNTVFQNYALFPHMTIYENVAFGLKIKKVKKSDINEKVTDILKLVGLADMDLRKPKQLSGGQQQRAALARALVNEPAVLLLDEPLGALDLKLRRQMQIELKSIQKRVGITFIYVTHDQEEALTMSDRMAVMQSGKVEQIGTPSQVYEEPKTEFVADFIGISNLFSGNLKRGDDSGLTMVTAEGFEIGVYGDVMESAGTITAVVRPEKIQLSANRPEGEGNTLRGRIEEMVYLGTVIQFRIDVDGKRLIVLEKNSGRRDEFKPDQEVFVSWDVASTVILAGND